MRREAGSGPLYRLIYYSRNVIAQSTPQDQLDAEVEAIVQASRRRNQADQVTGCLMCSASGFAQVLEGARDAVERTFERIATDWRHADVMMVSLTPAERLSFPGSPLALAWDGRPGVADPLRHLFTEAVPGGHRAATGADMLRLLRGAAGQPLAGAQGFNDPS